jgi:hypothetical protein
MSKSDPTSNVKDTQLYAALRQHGIKKKKAKRITQAVAAPSRPARKGSAAKKASRKQTRSSTSYDNWTKAELLNRAKIVGVKGRSTMNKKELTRALRAS